VRDPIRSHLKPVPEPSKAELEKKKHGDLAASGSPAAGRTTLSEVKRKGFIGFLQLLGPGLITGASDDDPSGIGTYSQVGSQFGYGLLWTSLVTFPLMSAVQELCSRIALQTGVGLGVTLRRKFPTWLVAIAILALIVANTFNIGADLGAVAAGGSLLSKGAIGGLWLVVPVALLIIGMQLFATYATIFKIFKWLTLALFAYVITAFFAHPQLLSVLVGTVVPQVQFSRDFVMAMVAVLGTTISPYLFFWQASSEVDELLAAGATAPLQGRPGLRRAELHAARADILIGLAFSNIVMYFIMLTSAAVLHAHGKTGIATADQAAAALAPFAGPFAFIVFAVGLIGSGLLAIPILAGSASYALKEFLGFQGNLASKPKYRPTFYMMLSAATVAGVLMNLAHLDTIRALFITAVINGLVAAPVLALIVLVGADRRIMKEHVSGKLSRTLTWLTTALMGAAALAMIVTVVVGR
jgi:Mn2+/Fe2+ NRAMP family transporter